MLAGGIGQDIVDQFPPDPKTAGAVNSLIQWNNSLQRYEAIPTSSISGGGGGSAYDIVSYTYFGGV